MVVERLLSLASIESQKALEKSEQVSLANVVGEVCKQMEPLFVAKNVELKYAAEGQWPIMGDAFLLSIAVRNLVQNALEFSPNGTTVNIEMLKSNGDTVLRITDRGQGIPDYAQDKIFQRFYSLQRPDTGKKSSGLGLSFAREIVELHGGTITVVNSDESGVVAELQI